ncbi:hypothetical protein M422DRAFT_267245 [Sphaerobolus stellatus SS14]|uniref:Unplaced genomic scaffold SPHSTscaffold_172, whole genome shotgun sequence n=1 Tax=Sphaerobolus stellatus (strain SS14) TaxID=990650 RepID=A0A0C9U9H1_SPHS4|nr:hypothetical protein M422DRAFT_267245 [Sphaerobolus stellatus SS14]
MTSLIHSLPAASRPLIAIDPTFLSPFHISSLAAPISADLAVNSITKTHQRPLRYLHERRHPPQRLHPEAKGNKDTINALYTRLQFLQNAHRTRLLRRLSTPVSRSIQAITTQSRSWRRTRKFVNERVLTDEAKERNERRGKGDFPFGGMVSFRIGSAGELADDGAAERFLTRTRFFTLAESLGGVESLPELS